MKGRGLFHAYIAVGSDEAARDAFILKLARSAVCSGDGERPCGVCRQCRLALAGAHPDIIFVERPLDDKGKPKRELPVDSIRKMASSAWVLPQEAEKKVYIIREADLMNVQAQNAALKLLEEPPSFAVFILGTNTAAPLLPTLRSRCESVFVPGERSYEPSPEAERYLLLAGRGDLPGLCAFLTDCERMDSAQVLNMLAQIRRSLVTSLAYGGESFEGSPELAARLLTMAERAEEFLRRNVGVKHVLGWLCVGVDEIQL
ncbi:MAG: hypothetical protein LBM18_00625 [Oscillospiraceae bacterium]|jgi:hypothetical protein|nr:hypothetical protein [Oscillospiraceae bacterium]